MFLLLWHFEDIQLGNSYCFTRIPSSSVYFPQLYSHVSNVTVTSAMSTISASVWKRINIHHLRSEIIRDSTHSAKESSALQSRSVARAPTSHRMINHPLLIYHYLIIPTLTICLTCRWNLVGEDPTWRSRPRGEEGMGESGRRWRKISELLAVTYS